MFKNTINYTCFPIIFVNYWYVCCDEGSVNVYIYV